MQTQCTNSRVTSGINWFIPLVTRVVSGINWFIPLVTRVASRINRALGDVTISEFCYLCVLPFLSTSPGTRILVLEVTLCWSHPFCVPFFSLLSDHLSCVTLTLSVSTLIGEFLFVLFRQNILFHFSCGTLWNIRSKEAFNENKQDKLTSLIIKRVN